VVGIVDFVEQFEEIPPFLLPRFQKKKRGY
jgi:hypothetical protein